MCTFCIYNLASGAGAVGYYIGDYLAHSCGGRLGITPSEFIVPSSLANFRKRTRLEAR